jgi:hypothetical protein
MDLNSILKEKKEKSIQIKNKFSFPLKTKPL